MSAATTAVLRCFASLADKTFTKKHAFEALQKLEPSKQESTQGAEESGWFKWAKWLKKDHPTAADRIEELQKFAQSGSFASCGAMITAAAGQQRQREKDDQSQEPGSGFLLRDLSPHSFANFSRETPYIHLAVFTAKADSFLTALLALIAVQIVFLTYALLWSCKQLASELVTWHGSRTAATAESLRFTGFLTDIAALLLLPVHLGRTRCRGVPWEAVIGRAWNVCLVCFQLAITIAPVVDSVGEQVKGDRATAGQAAQVLAAFAYGFAVVFISDVFIVIKRLCSDAWSNRHQRDNYEFRRNVAVLQADPRQWRDEAQAGYADARRALPDPGSGGARGGGVSRRAGDAGRRSPSPAGAAGPTNRPPTAAHSPSPTRRRESARVRTSTQR